jgi:hypothetical protein
VRKSGHTVSQAISDVVNDGQLAYNAGPYFLLLAAPFILVIFVLTLGFPRGTRAEF